VPEKYILTPADQIHFGDMIKEQNAAVRLAIIKKFGFRRLMDTIRYRIVSRADGNSLMEFTIHPTGKRSWVPRFRALQLTWQDKTGAKETFLPVPRLARQFGEDVNSCEQVRHWTLGWSKEAMAVAET
jgi:hypothetical protein